MEGEKFSAIEETISFYTRNDFAIINCLLTDNIDDLWVPPKWICFKA